MRVVILMDSLGAGGTEASMAELLPRLGAHGIEPLLVALKPVDTGVEARLKASGIESRVLGVRRAPEAVVQVRKLLGTVRPAVLHTNLFVSDVVGRIAATGRTPVLTSLVNLTYHPSRFHDPRVRPVRLHLSRMIDKWSARALAGHFHAVTGLVKNTYARDFGIPLSRITVVERGRDPSRWQPVQRSTARRALGLSPSDVIFLNVGRHEYQKNQVRLVRAFAAIASADRRLRLLILGREGNATSEIERAILEHGVSSRVNLIGYRDDVSNWLAASDVMVMPSLFEGTGGAAIEAMAMGRPVITTPSMAEVVAPSGAGLIVDAEDIPMIAAAMQRLAGDLDAREQMGASGREEFLRRYTLERSAQRMADLYRGVSRQRPRPWGSSPSVSEALQ